MEPQESAPKQKSKTCRILEDMIIADHYHEDRHLFELKDGSKVALDITLPGTAAKRQGFASLPDHENMRETPTPGALHTITCAMGGGKTTELFRIAETLGRHEPNGCLYVNWSGDVRDLDEEGNPMEWSTHSQILKRDAHNHLRVKMIQVDKLSEIPTTTWADYTIVLIDEAQFFSDLTEIVLEQVAAGKEIYVAGLMTSFNYQIFGRMHELIGFVDSHTQLKTGLCQECSAKGIRRPALFSKREGTSKALVEVGKKYHGVCRECILKSL